MARRMKHGADWRREELSWLTVPRYYRTVSYQTTIPIAPPEDIVDILLPLLAFFF
jgi:hypothetical protein